MQEQLLQQGCNRTASRNLMDERSEDLIQVWFQAEPKTAISVCEWQSCALKKAREVTPIT